MTVCDCTIVRARACSTWLVRIRVSPICSTVIVLKWKCPRVAVLFDGYSFEAAVNEVTESAVEGGPITTRTSPYFDVKINNCKENSVRPDD